MKIFKNVLYIIGLILIVFVSFYFIDSCRSINKKVIMNNFSNKMFKSKDEKDYLYFQNLDSLVVSIDDVTSSYPSLTYVDNIFKATSDNDTFYLLALDTSTLYCGSYNIYFYYYEV